LDPLVAMEGIANDAAKLESLAAFRPPPGLPPPSPEYAHGNGFSAAAVQSEFEAPPGLAHPMTTLKSDPLAMVHSAANQDNQEFSSAPRCLNLVACSPGQCSVTWRIDGVSSKLRTSRGFPLLSPSFVAAGIPDLRLMFAPGEEWLDLAGAAMSRKQKQQRKSRSAAVAEGLPFGAVKVKASDAENSAGFCFDFDVFLGEGVGLAASGRGCDLSKSVVQSRPFDVDWRQNMEGGSLVLRFVISWKASASA